MELNIASSFSKTPGGRFKADGPYSGEAFREELSAALIKARLAGQKLTVVLDGTAGFATSFLEEAFGGLVRLGEVPAALLNDLEFVSIDEPYLIAEIRDYVHKAGRPSNSHKKNLQPAPSHRRARA